MASRRKTAEDKNTKLLRELASLPYNKQCFDCLQRGPTYINVTIGSFVCTTCSGILRGLTPPHRVKSISMTTFTPEEIEHLKSRGNEYCKYVWLGTYDTVTNSLESEVSDDQKKRDFMVQKYEKKRWYVDPDIAVKKMQADQLTRQKNSVVQPQIQGMRTGTLPETQPLSRLLGKSPTPLVVQTTQPVDVWPHPVSSASAPAISTKTTTQNQGSRSIDLLSELAGNSTPNTQVQSSSASTANGNFANFETAFNSVEKSGWTSFDDDLDPLSSTAISRSLTLGKDSFSRVGTYSTAMPRPLSLPTFAPTNPFKSSPLISSGNTSTPSQWPSFTASSTAAPTANLPSSASLDTYPMQSRQEPAVNTFSPPLPKVTTTAVTATQQTNADRYAALADLDSLFHQPASTKAPSWTVETSSSGSFFDVPASNHGNSTFSIAPSNPFTSTELWNQTQVTKTQTFQSANPFQSSSESGIPYCQITNSQVYAPFPIPMVGNSPSDDGVRNQFNANFSAFPTQVLTSPTNGYGTNQMLLQNGGFTSPTPGTTSWGIPSSIPQWSSSHLGQGGLFSSEKSVEPAQHSDWIQNPVNPFMASSSNLGFPVAPRNNSSNPFL
ncbi:arf-GAP domain and FG repeat-containing protein 1-like isoform X1 [Stegodyphus dumicola]|uniref:arf-GAP domain and FG repeat-containing protein 1-like isoform X1 n=1 Tax=Stegodyphus dumicola TaxID=202533 RepID=UPI0015B190FD|nr:arf-GAP domain and FG repeat-containing protein 1-like isoform X1 [Stegodyphus dumicola]